MSDHPNIFEIAGKVGISAEQVKEVIALAHINHEHHEHHEEHEEHEQLKRLVEHVAGIDKSLCALVERHNLLEGPKRHEE